MGSAGASADMLALSGEDIYLSLALCSGPRTFDSKDVPLAY